MERLEHAVDVLAIAYPGTPPAVLLPRVRRHLGYVSGLLDARSTPDEHGRLLTAGGWLSLLAANYWRAEEVISAVAARAESEARELREAYREIRRTPSPPELA